MVAQYKKNSFFVTGLTLVGFVLQSVVCVPLTRAQGVPVAGLPAPGVFVSLSGSSDPILMRGVRSYPDDPLRFDFIMDVGDQGGSNDGQFAAEAKESIKYFLASLTVPEEDMWVNLSPQEADRIIPEKFGMTDMGRDLLAQDYLLKQITASLLSPDDAIGAQFWKKIYESTRDQYGSSVDIPMDSLSKVWIVPEKAVVFTKGNSAFVVEAKLKVMMAEDYFAYRKNNEAQLPDGQVRNTNGAMCETMRSIIIPAIEKEVNQGAHFAKLRQIFHAMILATWFKRNLKESFLGREYVDQRKVNGVDVDDHEITQKIYAQYVQAFEKGVYDLIREEYDPVSQVIIPRKYFTGGAKLGFFDEAQLGTGFYQGTYQETHDPAVLGNSEINPARLRTVVADMAAMTASPEDEQKEFMNRVLWYQRFLITEEVKRILDQLTDIEGVSPDVEEFKVFFADLYSEERWNALSSSDSNDFDGRINVFFREIGALIKQKVRQLAREHKEETAKRIDAVWKEMVDFFMKIASEKHSGLDEYSSQKFYALLEEILFLIPGGSITVESQFNAQPKFLSYNAPHLKRVLVVLLAYAREQLEDSHGLRLKTEMRHEAEKLRLRISYVARNDVLLSLKDNEKIRTYARQMLINQGCLFNMKVDQDKKTVIDIEFPNFEKPYLGSPSSIFSVLGKSDSPMTILDIIRELGISEEAGLPVVKRNLGAMVKRHFLKRTGLAKDVMLTTYEVHPLIGQSNKGQKIKDIESIFRAFHHKTPTKEDWDQVIPVWEEFLRDLEEDERKGLRHDFKSRIIASAASVKSFLRNCGYPEKELKDPSGKIRMIYEELAELEAMKEEFDDILNVPAGKRLAELKQYGKEIASRMDLVRIHLEQAFPERKQEIDQDVRRVFRQAIKFIDDIGKKLSGDGMLIGLEEDVHAEEVIAIKDFLKTVIRSVPPSDSGVGSISDRISLGQLAVILEFPEQEEEDIEILGDPVKLNRVFTNLLKNANEATPEGGKIFVRVSQDPNRDDVIKIEVEDTGSGISEENLSKIFGHFSTKGQHGEGVGLTLVKRMVEAHGGIIEVESQVRKGTKFTVFLPVYGPEDHAMLIGLKNDHNSEKAGYGGIDFNPEKMFLEINGQTAPVIGGDLLGTGTMIFGLSPVIIDILPVSDLSLWLGE